MTTNGRAVGQLASAEPSLHAALLVAEQTGQVPATAWPALRALLLATTDPQLAQAVAPLQQFVEAQQALVQARTALTEGIAALPANTEPARLAEAATQLAMLAEDLAARAQHLASLSAP